MDTLWAGVPIVTWGDGTDMGASAGFKDHQRREQKERIKERNGQFARYYATDDEIPFGDLLSSDKPVRETEYYVTGLALPKEILKKIYYDNVLKWFPGVEQDYRD